MNDIIESSIITLTSYKKQDIDIKDNFVIFCKKPENFKEMVLCENKINKKPIKYEVLDYNIKFIIDCLDPIIIYYKVTKSEIFNLLNDIVEGDNNE